MSAGSPGSTLISLSLFSVVGKEFSVPWVVFREKGGMRRGEGGWFKSRRTTGKQQAQTSTNPEFLLAL